MTTPLTLSDLQARIQHASAQRTPLCIRGGGSKDWYGQTPRGDNTCRLSRRSLVLPRPLGASSPLGWRGRAAHKLAGCAILYWARAY